MAVFASPGAFSAPASKYFLGLGGVRASGVAMAQNTGTLAAFTDELRLLLAVLAAARPLFMVSENSPPAGFQRNGIYAAPDVSGVSVSAVPG